MIETDWREILNYSQKELKQADKEKLCENLSWMEADDIELNFSDLKTLFRLSQDILKFKSEQVNTLLGQVETLKRRYGKAKEKIISMDSPAKESDFLETISHQEEVIKANKEILEQLYSEIADLEKRKSKVLEEENNELKEKLAIFKEKLKESTQIIENLTENLFALNSECGQLKSTLGKSEEEKAHLKLCAENFNQRATN
ncbi:unnamed protein product [Leptosia nina]|uniref:Uncharacterized protein n=1 Tax=Leptosia nina TaxID=320188 RepID=A0AAV1JCD1_9NEOP